jgi:hypothetical protein
LDPLALDFNGISNGIINGGHRHGHGQAGAEPHHASRSNRSRNNSTSVDGPGTGTGTSSLEEEEMRHSDNSSYGRERVNSDNREYPEFEVVNDTNDFRNSSGGLRSLRSRSGSAEARSRNKKDLKRNIIRTFMSGAWALSEGDEKWVPDDSAWHCRHCAAQFSLFQRKHHCRRCGGVYCDDDAPHVDVVDCLPESFTEVCAMAPIEGITLCNMYYCILHISVYVTYLILLFCA